MTAPGFARPRPATPEELQQHPHLPAILRPHAVYQSEAGETVVADGECRLSPWPPTQASWRRAR
jgi:hypothetical protein